MSGILAWLNAILPSFTIKKKKKKIQNWHLYNFFIP